MQADGELRALSTGFSHPESQQSKILLQVAEDPWFDHPLVLQISGHWAAVFAGGGTIWVWNWRTGVVKMV